MRHQQYVCGKYLPDSLLICFQAIEVSNLASEGDADVLIDKYGVESDSEDEVSYIPMLHNYESQMKFKFNPLQLEKSSWLVVISSLLCFLKLHKTRTPFPLWASISTIRPEQNGNYFVYSIFKSILLNGNCCILIQFSLNFVPL